MAQNYYLMHHGVKGMKWGVRRTPAQLGHRTASGKVGLGKSTRTSRGLSKSSSGSKLKQKLSDPEFQRKAATAAKIALVIGAAYAGHKVINDPRVMAAGKDAITKVVSKSGAIKASTIQNVMNSTEFKAAKAVSDAAKSGALGNSAGVRAAKTAVGVTGKALKTIGSEDVRNTITGIGAMARTTAILKSQIKDLRENKPDGDKIDRAIKRTQQLSEIGENVNTLARGPKGASTSSTSSSGSSSNNSATQNKSVFENHLTGERVAANHKLNAGEKAKLKKYRQDHPNLTIAEALDELGWRDKDSAKHSDISIGWSFNRMAGCRYIF